MKPLKTKQQIRQELNQQIESFLNKGGNVEAVDRGISGNLNNTNLFKQSTQFEPKQTRTPVGEVIQELESRKGSGAENKNKRPKRVLIKDDFGEPIRWVWQE